METPHLRESVLTRHIGHTVEVISSDQSGPHLDSGTLVAVDSIWLVVKKSGGELIYLAIYNVRSVKIAQ